MHPVNAGEEILPDSLDPFAAMSDRELLEYIASNMAAAVTAVEAVQNQVAPVMDKLSKNPMFKMLGL